MELMCSHLARFYGWTHEDIISLDLDTAHSYYQAIPVIDARETLSLVKAFSYPHYKQIDRDKYLMKLNKLAFPADAKPMDGETLARLING